MKKTLKVVGVIGLFLASSVILASAQEVSSVSDAVDSNAASSDLRQEFSADKKAMKEQRQAIEEHAVAAREEEYQLQQQIHNAIQAGDMETAKKLREQLSTTHKENIEERHQDMQGLRQARQDFRGDIKEARQEGKIPPRNPPGYNPPGKGPLSRDRIEDVRDRREDVRDKREDVWDAKHNPPPGTAAYRRDKLEDVRDRREDVRDRREDVYDRYHQGRPYNPPGYNPPGRGPGNPPGYNPPGTGPVRPAVRDRVEDIRDKREDVRDRREDVRDKREDVWDAKHNPPPGTAAYRRDKLEDVRDRREDVRDRREDRRDRREDIRDKGPIHATKDAGLHRGAQQGVKDHGAGVGRGAGQGGAHRGGAGSSAGGGRRR